MNEFISTFLVVWRETFEGLLVLFLLSTRLIKENMWVRSKKFVGLGVVAGVTFSLVTAVTLFKIEDVNDSPWALNLRWILPIIASFLMVHMVFWMAKHGKEVSGNIKNLVTQSEKKSFY